MVLGVFRCLEVAPVLDRRIPPHPAPGRSWGRGVEASVLAMLEGPPARYKVGPRLDERGMGALLPPGCTRAALHDDRFGHLRDARCAAPLTMLLSALALNALEVSALPPPWLPQAPPTIALDGA
jgi:hypothetical protein